MTFILICIFLLSCLCCCGRAAGRASLTFFSMDTVMMIDAWGVNAESGVSAARDEIQRVEKLFSATLPESDVYRINENSGSYVSVSQETVRLISRVIDVCAASEGALDITIYPIVQAWGFVGGQHRVPEDIASLLSFVGYDRIHIDGNRIMVESGMSIDLGAVGKGYASDMAAQALLSHGVTGAVMSLGGNVYVMGKTRTGTPFSVGIRDPYSDSNGLIGTISTTDCAVVTSGGYERYFTENGKTYHHIIDPSTGFPADNDMVSVTVISADACMADMLSTAFFVMGSERALDYYHSASGFDMIVLTDDGTLIITPGIRDSFVAADAYSKKLVVEE